MASDNEKAVADSDGSFECTSQSSIIWHKAYDRESKAFGEWEEAGYNYRHSQYEEEKKKIWDEKLRKLRCKELQFMRVSSWIVLNCSLVEPYGDIACTRRLEKLKDGILSQISFRVFMVRLQSTSIDTTS